MTANDEPTGTVRHCAACGAPIGPDRVGILDFHPFGPGYRLVHVSCIGQAFPRAS